MFGFSGNLHDLRDFRLVFVAPWALPEFLAESNEITTIPI
jgi:hypothetical protein